MSEDQNQTKIVKDLENRVNKLKKTKKDGQTTAIIEAIDVNVLSHFIPEDKLGNTSNANRDAVNLTLRTATDQVVNKTMMISEHELSNFWKFVQKYGTPKLDMQIGLLRQPGSDKYWQIDLS